jgi:hypothetical protein
MYVYVYIPKRILIIISYNIGSHIKFYVQNLCTKLPQVSSSDHPAADSCCRPGFFIRSHGCRFVLPAGAQVNLP